ncbi:MAG: hypothetical protein NVS4B2_26020 [Chloroflexota bacterium]
MNDTDVTPARRLPVTIALLHFTALPAPGGVEQLLRHQSDVLRALGYGVRVLVGAGDAPTSVEFCRIPGLDPARLPDVNAPDSLKRTIDGLEGKLAAALHDCDQCWVHNAFSLALHPALTAALHRLIVRMPNVQFVNYCSDISAVSDYAPSASTGLPFVRLLPDMPLLHVTISHARRRELELWAGIPERSITVIEPPVNALELLDLHTETRRMVDDLALLAADLVVLVPAKLLPHKNLELALVVADHLRRLVPVARMIVTGAASPHQPARSAAIRRSLFQGIRRLGLEEEVSVCACEGISTIEASTIRGLMRLADVVFVPSLEEGYGLPVRESLLMRVPCLCSDLPAFREAGGVSTNFFSLHDTPNCIAQRIVTLGADPVNADRRMAARTMQRFAAAMENLVQAAEARRSRVATPQK